MSLETGNRIQDLVATNPVGATDFASQGDDHIRLLKTCIQGSFPNLGATAVSLTGAQINDAALKSATQSVSGAWTFSAALTASAGLAVTGNFSVATGTVTLPAASIADAALSANIPLKNAANIFTATQSVLVAGNGDKLIGRDSSSSFQGSIGNTATKVYLDASNSSGGLDLTTQGSSNTRVNISNNGNVTVFEPGAGDALTVAVGSSNGYNITATSAAGFGAYLKLSQAGQTPAYIYNPASSDELRLNAGGADRIKINDGVQIGAPTGGDKGAGTLNSAAELYQGGVKVQSIPLVTSTSTTLVKGQLHHISGDATLPALGGGEWVCLVNNSGSPITITEHSGDTTYWTTGAVSVSTLTVPARGRIFASGAGSSVVYVSGDIGGYT